MLQEPTLSLLLLGLLSRGVARGSSSTTSSGGSGSGSTAGADVHQHVLDVLALEGLGEQSGPDGLDIGDLGGGDESLELLGLWGGIVSIAAIQLLRRQTSNA